MRQGRIGTDHSSNINMQMLATILYGSTSIVYGSALMLDERQLSECSDKNPAV